jgi:hypothetical protein
VTTTICITTDENVSSVVISVVTYVVDFFSDFTTWGVEEFL